MQHIWQFTCLINGVPHEGELVTDKSRINKIPMEIERKYKLLEKGEIKEMYIAKIR